MRRLLSFDCEGAALGATLDEGYGATGILFVTGGGQTRIGSHRLFERLSPLLAERGHACFRFDRRGVGDSDGDDPGFRGSGPDVAAAASAFRVERSGQGRMLGLGLCDGATALALFGAEAGLDGLILVNPWFVEAEANEPPAAAIRHHYWRRLASLEGWKRLLTGAISYRKLFKGIMKIASPRPAGLAAEVAKALADGGLPARLILASGDATAIAAEAEWNGPHFLPLRRANPAPLRVDSDSHTFARKGDLEALLEACVTAIEDLSGRG